MVGKIKSYDMFRLYQTLSKDFANVATWNSDYNALFNQIKTDKKKIEKEVSLLDNTSIECRRRIAEMVDEINNPTIFPPGTLPGSPPGSPRGLPSTPPSGLIPSTTTPAAVPPTATVTAAAAVPPTPPPTSSTATIPASSTPTIAPPPAAAVVKTTLEQLYDLFRKGCTDLLLLGAVRIQPVEGVVSGDSLQMKSILLSLRVLFRSFSDSFAKRSTGPDYAILKLLGPATDLLKKTLNDSRILVDAASEQTIESVTTLARCFFKMCCAHAIPYGWMFKAIGSDVPDSIPDFAVDQSEIVMMNPLVYRDIVRAFIEGFAGIVKESSLEDLSVLKLLKYPDFSRDPEIAGFIQSSGGWMLEDEVSFRSVNSNDVKDEENHDADFGIGVLGTPWLFMKDILDPLNTTFKPFEEAK